MSEGVLKCVLVFRRISDGSPSVNSWVATKVCTPLTYIFVETTMYVYTKSKYTLPLVESLTRRTLFGDRSTFLLSGTSTSTTLFRRSLVTVRTCEV